MAMDASKWGCIVDKVNVAARGETTRHGPACKHKWQSTLSEYKRIVDFHSMIGTKVEEYFHLTFGEKHEQNFPWSYF